MMDLENLKQEYNNLQKKLNDFAQNKNIGLSFNRKEYGELLKRSVLLRETIEKIEKIEKEIEDNERVLKETDDEGLKKLANEEILRLEKEEGRLEKEIETKWDSRLKGEFGENNEILMEIRAGAGGEEAALFVRELFEMYQKFATKQNWELSVLACHPTDLGGFREISFEIKGENVKNDLKYEGGVHRIQRIPETEKSGRIHTSTISVAVLPRPEEREIEINPNDLKIDVYRASGPGGQYVNRRESAVRATHLPTGIVATSQSARTQIQNRENALKILKARLFEKIKEKEEREIGAKRKSQIGTGERAEKIRTYNFPQDRITDHRIKKSWGHIEGILQGNIDRIIKVLKEKLS